MDNLYLVCGIGTSAATILPLVGLFNAASVSNLHANLEGIVFKNIVKLIVLVLFFGAVSFKAYAYDNGDFQIWHTDSEDIKIGKSTKFTMEQEFRFGEDASELFYQHYDWGFAWAFDKRLEIALGYRLIYEKYKHKWREEDDPYTNITAKFDIWKFMFEDRNRLEYRHFRYKDDFVRYRNKFTLKYPFDFKKITPYVSDEIFIASNATGFNENRFSSGLEFGLTKYVKADIYYMIRSMRGVGDKWSDANVLGTKLKISF